MTDRRQQVAIETANASETLSIYLITLVMPLVDQPDAPGICHDDVVTTALKNVYDPRRVNAYFDNDEQRLDLTEESLEAYWRRPDSVPQQDPALRVENAVVAPLVAEIHSDGLSR
jgi:hypothetical protein